MSTSAINKDFYQSRLELFAPGMAEHITPIKLETITPDMSMLAFTTHGKDGNEYYFALLQYDYMFSIKHATKIISTQFAKVIEYMSPIVKQKGRTELDQKSVLLPKSNDHVLLARTERPTGKGYWASYIQIMPGDDIAQKLESLNDKDTSAAQKLIQQILQKNPPTGTPSDSGDFLASWTAKQSRWQATIKDLKTNDTNLGINIFKNPLGNWESFYNYVDEGHKPTPNRKVS